MYSLSNSDLFQVSGGASLSLGELRQSMACYSYSFAAIGGSISAIYAICTNHPVTTIVGNTMTTASSFPEIFFIGLGISWTIGAIVGAGVAIYNLESVESN